MAYLRNKKDFDTGLLLSQCLSCKAYKMYIATIYLKIVQKQKYTIPFTVTADATDKSNIVFVAR